MPVPSSLTAPVESAEIPIEHAEEIIRDNVTIADGERLAVCRVTERSFRCNIWASKAVKGSVIREQEIVRSHFLTFNADDDITVS